MVEIVVVACPPPEIAELLGPAPESPRHSRSKPATRGFGSTIRYVRPLFFSVSNSIFPPLASTANCAMEALEHFRAVLFGDT